MTNNTAVPSRCHNHNHTSHNKSRSNPVMMTFKALMVVVALLLGSTRFVECRLADRARVVKARQDAGKIGRFLDNGRPLEGPSYRSRQDDFEKEAQSVVSERKQHQLQQQQKQNKKRPTKTKAPWQMDFPEQTEEATAKRTASRNNHSNTNNKDGNPSLRKRDVDMLQETPEEFQRKLSSQLTSCCTTYQSYSAQSLCALYGEDCESGETPSHDSGDEDCSQDGLSFIGISFSVNTANGNPYSYQLCDQFPMENIIDRNYDYIMSMDEDGWLVGGGYKSFDYSGKMPYIDSSHTELLRIGNMDPDTGGTSISQVVSAMESLSFAPFSIFPEYLKGGGGHHSGDDDDGGSAPSSDVTFIVSIVETYEDDDSYSAYEQFLEDVFDAMDAVGGGPCMDDHDTDPHVSMARGVKFWSATHMEEYAYNANLEVAVWQAMYPNGVVIGSSGSAAFPPGGGGQKQYVGYGNLYFFFDRANITTAFNPNRDLTSDEEYYATLTQGDVSSFYSSVTEVDYNYGGSGDGGGGDWEHNPYNWRASMAEHDFTDGWDLPPNCKQEGETFFGIPLSRSSDSKLQSTSTFQNSFDFDQLMDRNYTYVQSFGTNHGWLLGEEVDNAVGSIVDKDTAHIPIFYLGTTNANMGGMALKDMIKIGRALDFGTLYIKPAFVFVDANGHIKLQFEADPDSAMAYLYDNLCKELGLDWNYDSPYNQYGIYTNCAMHAAGDRAVYGCGPDGSNSGGFCPQMTIAYSPRFQSEDHAAAYLSMCNNYVDYWRSLYPTGVAVGTNNICPEGGCLALFLNRYDVYEFFKPDLGGSWVIWNGASMPPTYSPAPTWRGGCDEPHNFRLDKCFRRRHRPKAQAVAWAALGNVGQFSVVLVLFMAVTLSISVFLARARKKRRRGESYLGFFFRDLTRKKRKKRRGTKNLDLEKEMIPRGGDRKRSKSRSGASRRSSRSRSKPRRSQSRSRKNQTPSTRTQTVQPGSSTGRSRSRSSSRRAGNQSSNVSLASSSSRRSGVFDLTVTSPQTGAGEAGDTRQQLV